MATTKKTTKPRAKAKTKEQTVTIQEYGSAALSTPLLSFWNDSHKKVEDSLAVANGTATPEQQASYYKEMSERYQKIAENRAEVITELKNVIRMLSGSKGCSCE